MKNIAVSINKTWKHGEKPLLLGSRDITSDFSEGKDCIELTLSSLLLIHFDCPTAKHTWYQISKHLQLWCFYSNDSTSLKNWISSTETTENRGAYIYFFERFINNTPTKIVFLVSTTLPPLRFLLRHVET